MSLSVVLWKEQQGYSRANVARPTSTCTSEERLKARQAGGLFLCVPFFSGRGWGGERPEVLILKREDGTA